MISDPAAPELKFLCSTSVDLERPPIVVGSKAIFNVLGGKVDGPELQGDVLRSGGDWMTLRPDGSQALDVRMTIQMDDGEYVFCSYSGRIRMPPEFETVDLVAQAAADPSLYYFRAAPMYETNSKKYDWLNGIQAISVGRITEAGVAYDTFMVL